MTITKEFLVDLLEKFAKVDKLVQESSELDPETEPYLSMYAAKQQLIEMTPLIENMLLAYQPDAPEYFKLTAMLGAVHLYIGNIYLDTEEFSSAEKQLEKCNSVIEAIYSKPEIILLSTNMFNQFGMLFSLNHPDKAKIYLEKAQQLYEDFKTGSLDPIDIKDVFEDNKETHNTELARTNLEKIYTKTTFYLAQLYGTLKDALKSSVYCHITLQRQLQMNIYEPIDWALNAVTLSQFFLEKNGFKQARHHLAASLVILEKHRQELAQITVHDESYEAQMETFRHRSADVARCWAKYGLLLLSKSKERLMSHTDDIDVNCSLVSDLSKFTLTSDSTVSLDDLQQLDFIGIDASEYENQVTDQFVLTLEDARKVFLNIQKWCNKAIEYYNLNNLASDYIEIVLDQSQMYSYLLFFDDNPENQAKLHKRRIDILEDVLGSVNPQYYLQYCRHIWYELGQTYADIKDIKSDKLRESKERPKPQALLKINNLIDKSIANFNLFIDSFKDNLSGKKLPTDSEKPYLQAHFHIAGLLSRYITLDKNKQMENTEQSISYYKKMVECCDESENVKEMFKAEYEISKEMVALLPIKVSKLKEGLLS